MDVPASSTYKERIDPNEYNVHERIPPSSNLRASPDTGQDYALTFSEGNLDGDHHNRNRHNSGNSNENSPPLQDSSSSSDSNNSQQPYDSSSISNHSISSQTTNLQTMIHLLKGNVGPGCLSLPWAFSQLGITCGCMTTILLGLLTSYNALLLVKVKRKYYPDKTMVTYPDLGDLTYGSKFRFFVSSSLISQQLAICTVFFSFMGGNISAVARSMDFCSSEESWLSLCNSRVIMALLLPIVLFLSLLPNLRVLAPVTATGTILLFIAFGMIGVVMSLNWQDRTPSDSDGLVVHWHAIPLAVCAIMYSFEGVNLVLPIESAMKTPQHFDRIFIIAMILVSSIFSIFSTLVVITFGHISNGSITAYLMIHDKQYVGGNTWITYANIIVSFSVLFTYPLQLFPCISTLSQIRQRQQEDQSHKNNDELPCSNKYCYHPTSGLEENDEYVEPTPIISLPLDFDTSFDEYHEAFHDSDIYVSFENARGGRNRLGSYSSFSSLQNFQKLIQSPNQSLLKKTHQPNKNNSSMNISKEQEQNIPLSEKSQLKGDSKCMRSLLVLITFAAAASVPNVQELISLAGALAGSSAALIIPPLIQLFFLRNTENTFATATTERHTSNVNFTLLEYANEDKHDDITSDDNNNDISCENESQNARNWFGIIKCILFILTGIALAVAGTCASFVEIYHSYAK